MIVESVRKPLREITQIMLVNIDERSHAATFHVAVLCRLSQAVAGEIAQCLRSALVTASSGKAVDFVREVVIEADGYALHGIPSYRIVPTDKQVLAGRR